MANEKKPQEPEASDSWFILRMVLIGLALALLPILFVMLMWPQPESQAEIPYSMFVNQARAGNIAEVHIRGERISGTFVKPVAIAQQPEEFAPVVPFAPPETKSDHLPPVQYKDFRTVFPTALGDPELMSLLKARQVEIQVSPSGAPWPIELLETWGPMLLLLGLFLFIANRSTRSQANPFDRMRNRAYASARSNVTFEDVAGADEAKAELQEEVDFLKHPEKYHLLGASIPKGVLLVGPPGTGKTLLARAVAGQADVPFFSLNASEFVEMFVGVGASRVRDLFRQAREAAPAIVFIDELDAVGRRRGAGLGVVNDEREQTLNQLLGELDGFDQRSEVIILAATNRPDVLDPALLRPGRFDRQVVVGLPDRRGREAILRIHTRKLRIAPDVDIALLGRTTIGLSGADLANLANEAALTAARQNHPEVTMDDFDAAHDKLRLGAARPQLIDPAERRTVAYHESGHAVVAWLNPAADPVLKVTIVPHGMALGLTEQVPGEERHNYSLSYLRARLAVMLGGRTAEEIVFGEPTTGAENDLVEATHLARRMIARWGMGSLGLVVFKTDDQQPFLGYELSQGREYSEATASRIDEDVQRLMEETHQEVRNCLLGARERLDRLVDALLEEETVNAAELAEILGPRPRMAGTPRGVLRALKPERPTSNLPPAVNASVEADPALKK
jgi:cell division protease FtsH